ncbi:MAG: DNA polymerase III subunit beta [Chloroflexota bacterium]
MKITVQKQELQEKLSHIQNIVEKKNTMPILNHFLLSVEEAGAFITATDLETAFKEPLTVSVNEPGKMCIPARKLLEIVREVESAISLESVDGQWLKVKAGKSAFRLACLSEKEFPVWPAMEGTDELTIPSVVLREMVEKTLYAAGESDTRYVLNGLLLHVKPKDTVILVGTDGHRLALSEKKLSSKIKAENRIIVSRKAISELRRFLGDEGDVRIMMGKNHILLNTGNIEFLTRLIEGTYPNYEQVIPADNDRNVTVDRGGLIAALRRVSIMSRERSGAIKLDLGAAEMVVSASNPDLGEASDEIPIGYSGEAMAIGFNARYLLDALNAMESEKVVLRLKEPLSAALLLEEGREDHRCVVMPMRL